MSLAKIVSIVKQTHLLQNAKAVLRSGNRLATTNKHGVILNEPYRTSFGLLKVFLTVVPGLFIGAAISKNIANFLEENDLFVPSDDDDNDD